MVIRTFIWFVRYLLQLPIKITMTACRWIKLLTFFVTFWAKLQLMMHFIQNLSLYFHSFLDLYLNGMTHQLTTIGGIALAQAAIGSKICSFHFVCLLKAHINLNGIQRLYGLMR